MFIISIVSTLLIGLFTSESVATNYEKYSEELENQNFMAVSSDPCYVDKTEFIKRFISLDNIMLNHIFYTAPESFGKSTMLDMLKQFLEIEVDKNGNPQNFRKTRNYHFFQTNNFNIMADKSFTINNFGKHPVIFVDFKRITTNSFSGFLKSFCETVKDTYKRHEYLRNSKKLNQKEITLVSRLLDSELNILTEEELKLWMEAGRSLSVMLRKHFDKKCILLVDDLDSCLHKIMQMSSYADEKIIEDITEIIGIFLGTLINNREDNVFKSLMVGNLRLAEKIAHYIQPKVSHLSSYKYDRSHTSELFLANEKDVSKLMDKALNNNPKLAGLDKLSLKKKITEWYGGYDVYRKGAFVVWAQWIYNVFSIKNFCSKGDFVPYWPPKTRSTESLLNALDFNKFGWDIDHCVYLNESFNNITMKSDVYSPKTVLILKEIMAAENTRNNWESCSFAFHEYLIEMGYLTFLEMYKFSNKNTICEDASPPNKEVVEQLKRMLKIAAGRKVPEAVGKDMVEAVLNLGEDEKWYKQLAKCILKFVNAKGSKKPLNEDELLFYMTHKLLESNKFPPGAVVKGLFTAYCEGKVDLLVLRNSTKDSVNKTAEMFELEYGSKEPKINLNYDENYIPDFAKTSVKDFVIDSKIFVSLWYNPINNECSVRYVRSGEGLKTVHHLKVSY